jgi:hypothetical protein
MGEIFTSNGLNTVVINIGDSELAIVLRLLRCRDCTDARSVLGRRGTEPSGGRRCVSGVVDAAMYGGVLTLYGELLLESGHSRYLNLVHCRYGHVREVRIEIKTYTKWYLGRRSKKLW